MKWLIKIAAIVIAVPSAALVVAVIFFLLHGELGSGTVISGSMVKPGGGGVAVGSLLMGWEAEPGEIKVGDFVIGTDPGDGHQVSHRVISVSADSKTYRMQGDHNNLADAAEYSTDEAWIVFSVTPGLGVVYGAIVDSPFIAPVGYAAAGILAWTCFLRTLLIQCGRTLAWPFRRLFVSTKAAPARRDPRHSAGLAIGS